MKTTFGRTFSTAATILLLALLLLGATFQYLVQDFLSKKTLSELEHDAAFIADLSAAYSIEGNLSRWDFMLNLDVASRISDLDAVILSPKGEVLLCSNALLGCEHQGMFIDNTEYLQKVINNGSDSFIGIIEGLYTDSRYVVAVPIINSENQVLSGIIIASTRQTSSPITRSNICTSWTRCWKA